MVIRPRKRLGGAGFCDRGRTGGTAVRKLQILRPPTCDAVLVGNPFQYLEICPATLSWAKSHLGANLHPPGGSCSRTSIPRSAAVSFWSPLNRGIDAIRPWVYG